MKPVRVGILWSHAVSSASYIVSEQKRIAELALGDEQNRNLILLALAAGTVSSVALAKLYTKLTEDQSDDDLRSLAGTGLMAVGIGMLSVMWKLNKAQFRLPTLSAIAEDLESGLEEAEQYIDDTDYYK